MFNKLIPIFKLKKKSTFSSINYWENRYAKGGNSGSGSYGVLAKYKLDVLSQFISENDIKSVIDFGCGDGNQIKKINCENYVGLDVSPTSIKKCIKKYKDDKSKSFFLYQPELFRDNAKIFKAQLCISLEVIFHIVEDEIYYKYLSDLFNASEEYVMIFSSNIDEKTHLDKDNKLVTHVKHRLFTNDIDTFNFKLIDTLENPYSDISFSDFYIFKKN